jgi:hypothetical protein
MTEAYGTDSCRSNRGSVAELFCEFPAKINGCWCTKKVKTAIAFRVDKTIIDGPEARVGSRAAGRSERQALGLMSGGSHWWMDRMAVQTPSGLSGAEAHEPVQ